jgi:hypothetical protein
MIDLFNLGGGTFLRKITRYFIRPYREDDEIFLEEVAETSINSEGLYETRVSVGLTEFDCGHVVRSSSEIVGGRCARCGSVNCPNCINICERCLITVGNCCSKVLEGRIYCNRCYWKLKLNSLIVNEAPKIPPSGTKGVISLPYRGKRYVE